MRVLIFIIIVCPLFAVPSQCCLRMADTEAEGLHSDTSIVGLSDLVVYDDSRYIAVTDLKQHEDGARIYLVEVDKQTLASAINVEDWHDANKRPSDLEAICKLPNTDDFLLIESGNWQNREGRMFRVNVNATNSSATVVETIKYETLQPNNESLVGDQYEGVVCVAIDEDLVLIVLGERGGSLAHPLATLRWLYFRPSSNVAVWAPDGKAGLKVPRLDMQQTTTITRGIAALHLDTHGTLWGVGTEDVGDRGPFRSFVYPLALFAPDSNELLTLYSNPMPRVIEGQKLEGLAAPLVEMANAWLVGAAENEDLGGALIPLFPNMNP